MRKYKKVVLDLETTGLSSEYDEILQVSIIDENNNILIDEYCKPKKVNEWKESELINKISPEMVKEKKCFEDYIEVVSDILTNADEIIIYNADFEIGFLNKYGVKFNNNIYDLMYEFAEIYGQWNEYYGNYTWKSLDTCCSYYGYYLSNAHNSLEDCKATLYCYNKLINSEGAYDGKEYIGKSVKFFLDDVFGKLDEKLIHLRIRHKDEDFYNYVEGSIKCISDIKYKSLLEFKIIDLTYYTINMFTIYVDKCIEAELDIKDQKIERLKKRIKLLDETKSKLESEIWENQAKMKRLENKNRKLKEELGLIEKPKIYMFNSYGYYTSEYCKSTRKPMFKNSSEYRPFSNKLLSKTRCKQIKMPVKEDEEIYAFYRVKNGYCALYFRDI